MASVSDEKEMKLKTEPVDKKLFFSLEPALREANRRLLTSCSRKDLHNTRIQVEQIIKKIVEAMKTQSAVFAKLYCQNFGVGSIYEKTKVGEIDEFDIDIVMKIPEYVKPVLRESDVPGFVQFQLDNFGDLAQIDPELHRGMSEFVDTENYLLSEKIMLVFIQKIFNKAILNKFPNKVITIGQREYRITKVQYIEPALTITIETSNLCLSVDLVASFITSSQFWPKTNYRNYFRSKQNFFLTPARPIQTDNNNERFWRLSFHKQEKEIIYNRSCMKPAMRVLKQIRNHFKQLVHSYALKTIFFWELSRENPTLNARTPDFWKGPLSCIVIYMLEKYLTYLQQGNVPHFWNSGFNLLSYLSQEQLEQYVEDIEGMLNNIKRDPLPETLLEYLK